jgi:putative heme-binding domain-containing protein
MLARSHFAIVVLAFALPSIPGLAPLRAQGHGSIVANPFSTPEDQLAGAQTFRSQCAACHGPDGVGSAAGPALNTGTFQRGESDEALFSNITKGVPGTPMVAFDLNGREVWQLIAYIRSLGIGHGAETAKGDPVKGAAVFRSAGCVQCHTAGGPGGFLGPDLSEIGSRRRLAQLETSILDPQAEVAPDYWSLRARTKTGQEITGIRLNEDMVSYQFREASGRLRTVMKSDLASHEIVRTSPMPSFKGKLARAELDDLIAFLASLRAPKPPEPSSK